MAFWSGWSAPSGRCSGQAGAWHRTLQPLTAPCWNARPRPPALQGLPRAWLPNPPAAPTSPLPVARDTRPPRLPACQTPHPPALAPCRKRLMPAQKKRRQTSGFWYAYGNFQEKEVRPHPLCYRARTGTDYGRPGPCRPCASVHIPCCAWPRSAYSRSPDSSGGRRASNSASVSGRPIQRKTWLAPAPSAISRKARCSTWV